MITRDILDIRPLLLMCYHGGEDRQPLQGATTDPKTNKPRKINSAAHGLSSFMDRILRPILLKNAPINIIAVWEGGNHRRRALFEGYKNKPGQEESDVVMQAQVDILFTQAKQLLAGLGAVQMEVPFAEADDAIAYLCERLHGFKRVRTVDHDLLQLKQYPNTLVYIKDGTLSDYKGYPLDLVGLYKSIVGDSSDQYGGVRGMGEGAFKDMFDAYGHDGMKQIEHAVASEDYSELIAANEESPDRNLQKLLDQKDQWRLSYLLARLHPEWCEMSYEERVIRPRWFKRIPSRERVQAALREANLTTTIPAYIERYMPQMVLMDRLTLVQTDAEVIAKRAKQGPIVAFDYESYDSLKNPAYQQARSGFVDVLSQKVTGVSFCYGDNLQHSFYMPCLHRDTYNVSLETMESTLGVMLGDTLPVAHNCKFEQVVTYTNFGIEFDKVMDTAIMASYVDEEMEQGLKFLSKKFLNYDQITYAQVLNGGATNEARGSSEKDMRDISGEEVLQYGADDSVVTAHLYVLFQIILECERTANFVHEYETNFDYVMMRSYLRGVKLDEKRLRELEADDDALAIKTEAHLRGLLEQHCLEFNDEGFYTLWADLEEFYRNKEMEKAAEYVQKVLDKEFAAGDEASAELIAARRIELQAERAKWFAQDLEDKRDDCYAACRYVPLGAPTHLFEPFKVAGLSAASKTLGLASIRAIKSDKVGEWISGIRDQAAEQGIEFTEDQEKFLTLLDRARAATNVTLHEELKEFCKQVVFSNKEYAVGDELNVDSPKQMAELMYGKMGLPILIRNEDKTGTSARTRYDMEGAPGTSRSTMETNMAELAEDSWQSQVLTDVLTLRGINTRRELYYRPYPLWVSPVDGMIHAGIRNCGTKTRRPSGSSPNLLQLSKLWENARLREIIQALPDHFEGEPQVLIGIDFVQQELVIMAGESGDETLRSCYVGDNKRDVHSLTAAGLMGIEYDDFVHRLKVLKDPEAKFYRSNRRAKSTNFLMAYGGSAMGLSRRTIVPKATAEAMVAAYYETYPRVKEYQEQKKYEAQRYGFVTDCFGVRKHCSQIFSSNNRVRHAIERQAGNAPIQGGAASVLKVVLTEVRRQGVIEKTRATIIAPVYDEIVASVPVSTVVPYIRMMEKIMAIELPGLNISLSTSMSMGLNWGQASTNELNHEDGSSPTDEELLIAVDKLFHPEKYKKEKA